MEVVDSSDESDSDSDEKGDVSAVLCRILPVQAVISWVLVSRTECCKPTVHHSMWIGCPVNYFFSYGAKACNRHLRSSVSHILALKLTRGHQVFDNTFLPWLEYSKCKI